LLLFIKDDAPSEMIVEILEGDRDQMRLVQLTQRFYRHTTRTAVVYSVQIFVNIHTYPKLAECSLGFDVV